MASPTIARCTLPVAQFFQQRAAVAAGAVELDGGMGYMELMGQGMLDPVQQFIPFGPVVRQNLHMGRQGRYMGTDRPDVEMVDTGNTFDTANTCRNLLDRHSAWHPFHQDVDGFPQYSPGTDQNQETDGD